MKPRIFIGSSKEALDVAYVIQENLEYDSNATVWTQGIFELSSNSLDDLIQALENFDFGVFVFKPDDITEMRNLQVNTVRDNVIFELGLFIGRLGKKRVFFVLPDSTKDFHLPTDLLGVIPGKYNNTREDGNLKAALGPFCNQVRQKLKGFIYENLMDLEDENDIIKKIAVDKQGPWEFFLSSELLKSRMEEINRSYKELEMGLIFQKSEKLREEDVFDWFSNSINDIQRLLTILKKIFEIELIKAFGEPGVPGNIIEIKSAIDRIHSVCKELLSWEYNLQGIVPPEGISEAKELMKGWTKGIIDTINEFPDLIEDQLSPQNMEKSNTLNLTLKFHSVPNAEKIIRILKEFSLGLR
ncbi:nucleotide-binding protein [Gaetbulibacter sp. M240]|uniref:nucleotide-binding protein n=1 Tax=Gaetbulibacter sp. M240 TaxID=3126511 RepID=UPI00374E52E3